MLARRIALVLALGLVAQALVAGAGGAAEGRDARPGFVTGPSSGRPTEIAAAHVRAEHDRYGVSRDDVGDLMVTDAHRSRHTGVTHVYLAQRIEGLRVLGSSMTVNVAPDGSIIHVGPRLVPGLDAASGRAVLGPARAAERAARALGLAPTTPLRVLEGPEGPARETLLSPGSISLSPIPARLAYQALEDGRIRLAWSVGIEETSKEHWWTASVDAETGELLAAVDHVDRDSHEDVAAAIGRADGRPAVPIGTPDPVEDGSSYRVYALPLESPNDGERTLEENPADALGSPFGWHDTDGAPGPEFTTTQGNNVHAYIDTFNAGMGLPLTDADGGADLTFDFPFDPDAPPTVNKDAAVTNLFYWNNVTHDVFYRYGFDEVAGNFQVNNYDRGGLGGDSVRAEAQDGSGVNNANFATPADGNRPRMQMYVWTTGLGNRRIIDGDFDAGVIVHEYGHGISHRLTGGPGNVSCLSHQERASEGWSDWLAIAATALESESGPGRRGMGTYVLNQPNRQAPGIRPRPYSTNMLINGATYDDIKTLAVPHGVGYVWATMLWETFWDLVDKHGFNPNVYEDWSTGGNNLAIQLVMDGMKFQPCSPGFVDARDAILAADLALTGGENQCVVWRGFAKRGLGFSADQGSPASRSDGTEAFDTHPDCRARAEVIPSVVSATVPAGESTTVPITVRNTALADGQELVWAIQESSTGCASFANLPWVASSPSQGTTAAAEGTGVSVALDASGLPPGTHAGSLCLTSNDEQRPILQVPVELEVTG